MKLRSGHRGEGEKKRHLPSFWREEEGRTGTGNLRDRRQERRKSRGLLLHFDALEEKGEKKFSMDSLIARLRGKGRGEDEPPGLSKIDTGDLGRRKRKNMRKMIFAASPP